LILIMDRKRGLSVYAQSESTILTAVASSFDDGSGRISRRCSAQIRVQEVRLGNYVLDAACSQAERDGATSRMSLVTQSP
jgi:hypothetical protein